MTTKRKHTDNRVSRVEHQRVIAQVETMRKERDMWREMYFEDWMPAAFPAAIVLGLMCGSWLAAMTR
jgi:hypothetical protein